MVSILLVSIILCSVTLCSRLPGGEETGLGSSDGKVGQRSQPSVGELLKRPGEMMSWTLSSLMFFPSLLQQWRSPAAGAEPGFGQTHHAHQRNTRHWWLHWAEIGPPSIRSCKGLLWKIGFPGLGLIMPCCTHCCINWVRFEFESVSKLLHQKYWGNCSTLPYICKAKAEMSRKCNITIATGDAEVIFCKLCLANSETFLFRHLLHRSAGPATCG